jgi:hypothetical protein
MSNGIKFTHDGGVVTITLKCSHIRDGTGTDTDSGLTEEEMILLANEQVRKATELSVGQIRGFTSFEAKVTTNDKGGGKSDENENEVTVDVDDDDVAVMVDGKEYKKYGRLIVSFVDTGAGVSKVIQLLTTASTTAALLL